MLECILRRNVQFLGLGDMRSTVSVFLYSVFRSADLLMFDDGLYSTSVDSGGDPLFNSGYAKLKSKLIFRCFSSRSILRHTILTHKIYRSYTEVERSSLSSALKIFDTRKFLSEIPEVGDLKKRKTFIYVESSLKGWVSLDTEKALYKRLVSYCQANEMNLLVVAHRLSTEEGIIALMPDGARATVLKLGIPIEFLFLEYEGLCVTFGFCFTTATQLALDLVSDSKLVVFEVDEELVFDSRKSIWKSYFGSLHDFSSSNKNLEVI